MSIIEEWWDSAEFTVTKENDGTIRVTGFEVGRSLVLRERLATHFNAEAELRVSDACVIYVKAANSEFNTPEIYTAWITGWLIGRLEGEIRDFPQA